MTLKREPQTRYTLRRNTVSINKSFGFGFGLEKQTETFRITLD